MMRRLLVTLLVVAVAVAAVVFWPKAETRSPALGDPKPTATAPAAAPSVRASVYIVKPSALDNKVMTTGTLLANEEVVLTSEASGKVIALQFNEGTRVKRGQLLAQLNDAELRAQLTKNESRLKLTQAQEYRQRVLLERKAISQQEYDVVAGELNTAQADVQLTKAQLVKTQIRAPFDGVIGLRRVSEGAYVSPGTAIASLQNYDQVKIEFAVPEKYSSLVRAGQDISFTVRSSDQQFTGRVFAVEPKIDPETRSLTIRALASNAGGLLVPGAFADVELVLSRLEQTLLVPAEAVVPELSGHRVFKVVGGKAQPTKVIIGLRTRERLQILDGLSAGDSLIVSGVLLARPGSTVNVSEVVN